MTKPEGKSQRTGLWTTLAMTAVAGTGTVALTLPMTVAYADPPAPPPGTTTAAPPPAPVDPNAAPAPFNPFAPPPPPVDPNAPDPNAPPPPPPPPEPGRINVPTGGFSYLLPAGWTAGDASRISYGQAVLLKTPPPGRPPPPDTSVLLGKLDLRLFAGAEQDDQNAAIRLASDMGEFYMPFPGTRINQQTVALNAAGMPGAAAYYEVKFTDPNRPNGQIWAAAIGTVTPRQGATPPQNDRWFVVWLGSATNPIDTAAATTLADSIRPYAPPPPPPPPEAPPDEPPAEPGAPRRPRPPPNKPQVGVPVPVPPENAPGMTPPA